jgi:glycosyltransferase involved in cell wall biosynthesis
MSHKSASLTVLLLIRNHERFVEDCAYSISEELNSDTPIIVVDSGSTDQSIRKLLEYLCDWSGGVQVIYSKGNISTLENVVLGVSEIRSSHFILLSGDDVLGEEYGNSLYSALNTDLEHKTIYNFSQFICDEDLKPLRRRSPRWDSQQKTNLRLLSICNPGTAPGSVIPINLVRNIVSGEDIPNTLIEDYWLWWKLVYIADFKNIDTGQVYYRIHPASLSQSSKSKQYAISLGFSAAIPFTSANNVANRLLSIVLIPRWIRHLNFRVWGFFFEGYQKKLINLNKL